MSDFDDFESTNNDFESVTPQVEVAAPKTKSTKKKTEKKLPETPVEEVKVEEIIEETPEEVVEEVKEVPTDPEYYINEAFGDTDIPDKCPSMFLYKERDTRPPIYIFTDADSSCVQRAWDAYKSALGDNRDRKAFLDALLRNRNNKRQYPTSVVRFLELN